MTFSIFIQAPYIDIEAFYPYEGWDEEYEGWSEDEDAVAQRAFIERCIAVDPEDEEEMEELWDLIGDPGEDYLSGVETAVMGCDARIQVDEHPDGDFRLTSKKSSDIENPFSDYEKYALPELEDLIPEVINSKFCFVKVWENSGGFLYESDGEFDLSKLDCVKGKFLYDGKEFNFTDGDGSSSEYYFYKDGNQA